MVTYKTVPENKGKQDYFEKAVEIAKKSNEKIAKLFGEKPHEDITFAYYHSAGTISGKIHSEEREFKGYVDGSKELMIIHPEGGDGLFTDLWKEMGVLTDFVLVKYYLCQKYFPKREDFKMYYKYVSDMFAQVISGKYPQNIANFEYKMYVPKKKLKKDVELGLLLNFMNQTSGPEFLFSHLDKIMEDCDIRKTVSTIYNKTVDEIMLPLKEKAIEQARLEAEMLKEKRMKQIEENRKNPNNNFNNRPGNRQGRFVTRDKFKTQNNNSNNNNNDNQRRYSNPNNKNGNNQDKEKSSKYGYSKGPQKQSMPKVNL